MTDYDYYAILPGSPAEKFFTEHTDSKEAMRKAAAAFVKKWLPKSDAVFYASDTSIAGFCPGEKQWNWKEFRAHFDAKLWKETDKSGGHWITPRKREHPEAYTAFLALPHAISIDLLSKQLFGMSRFVQGMKISSLCYRSTVSKNEGRTVFGIPWLAARGVLQDFGSGTFKLCNGVSRLQYDEALEFMLEEQLKPKKGD